jgi:hypothetical protein
MNTPALRTFAMGLGVATWLFACSDSGGGTGPSKEKPDGGGGGGNRGVSSNGGGGSTTTGSGGSTASNGGKSNTVGDAAPSTDGESDGGNKSDTPPSTGQVDGVFPKADVLPKLVNIVATMREDSIAVDFDPVDGAVDYRIFVLPKDADVSLASGLVVVHDATYRCAGTRQGWDAVNNMNKEDMSLARAQGEYTFKTDIPRTRRSGTST